MATAVEENVPPAAPSGTATTTATDPLRGWLLASGGVLHPAVKAEPIPSMGGGFGVVAAGTDLPPRTEVAFIPRRLMVTAPVARRRCGLPSSVPAVESIMVFLVTERLLATETPDGRRAAADLETSSGNWAPWVSRLPPRYDNLIELEDAVDEELVNRSSTSRSDSQPQRRRSEADEAALQAVAARLLPCRRYRDKVLLEIEAFHRRCDTLLVRRRTDDGDGDSDEEEDYFAALRHEIGAEAVATLVTRRLLRWAERHVSRAHLAVFRKSASNG